jgi:hypothetical protein
MKRKGLSWDGGKKRIIAAAMMLSVLAAPGVAHADTGTTTSTEGTTVTSEVELQASPIYVRVTRSFFGVSWG